MSLTISIPEVKGFSKLTEQQKQLFQRVYKNHMAAFGTEKRKKYAVDQLKEIKWDQRENCLKVYWKGDRDWYHYDTKGCWY